MLASAARRTGPPSRRSTIGTGASSTGTCSKVGVVMVASRKKDPYASCGDIGDHLLPVNLGATVMHRVMVAGHGYGTYLWGVVAGYAPGHYSCADITVEFR